MDELREKIAEICGGNFPHMKADAILAIPEIAEALEVSANLRANQERQRRMTGHSISTNRRDPV